MQEPTEIIYDEMCAEVHSQELPENFQENYGSLIDEQIAQQLLESSEDSDFVASQATQLAITQFHFVEKLMHRRTNTKDNTRRTKILAGNAKINALLSRFKI